MCHGTFDLVHPGHIRHLLYAKSKADILVASLTADAHIAKANFRPFVPQELRAFNLAALEDGRLRHHRRRSDAAQEHLDHPARLFRQGLRIYPATACIPRTAEEIDGVEAYGGEMIFTPGDIVYSSSHIIETEPPDIATEKLMAMLMDAEGLSMSDLHRTIDLFKGIRVHVVGDTIVDSLHPLRADRRHDEDADLERRASTARSTSSAAPASSPSICARPAPR